MNESKNYIALISLLILVFSISCTNKKEAAREEINAGLKEMYNSQFEAAKQHFEKAIQWNESNAEPYLYLGRISMNQGQIPESLAYVKKAIELNSGYGEAYRTLAQINTMLGQKDKACENYKKAKECGIPNLDNYLKLCK